MSSECKVHLEADSEERPSPRRSLTTALLLLTLCLCASAAAVLLFSTHSQKPGPEEKTFDLHHQLRQISNVRAAIHLEGRYNEDMTNSVEWLPGVDQSHSQGGFVLDQNEIVIPKSGLYFVYSQASFRVSCSADPDDDDAQNSQVYLSHTVKLSSTMLGDDDSKRTYEPILHSVRTACQKTSSSDPDQDGHWFTAIYMGAVFNLNRGDRLRTEMMERMLQQLEDGPGKTFFGVFAL